MTVHAVLVERNEQVGPVTHVGDLSRPRTNGQKSMAAANDGLIGVVGIQVKTPPAEDLRENVSRRSYTLTGRASDTDSEGLLHNTLPQQGPAQQSLLKTQNCRRPVIGSNILGPSARSKMLSTALDELRSSFLACATNGLPNCSPRTATSIQPVPMQNNGSRAGERVIPENIDCPPRDRKLSRERPLRRPISHCHRVRLYSPPE